MIKAIIFDCFNVLVNDPTRQLLQELERIDPAKRQEFSAVTHAADSGIITDAEGAVEQSRLLGMSLDAFTELRNKGETVNEPLMQYAISLKGHFKIGMLSNIVSRERLAIRFSPGQVESVFDAVVASGEVGVTKPNPEIFTITAHQLGVLPEECVMIDDILENCTGAREAGMQAIHHVTNQQTITELNTLIDRGGEKD